MLQVPTDEVLPKVEFFRLFLKKFFDDFVFPNVLESERSRGEP